MSDLKLSERLRIGIALKGGMTLELDRDQAVLILKMIERGEQVRELGDALAGMFSENRSWREARERNLRMIERSLIIFCACLIAVTYAIAFL